MKIGILTQPLLNNYGGLLQNYALQQVLKGMGHEVVTIDWTDRYDLRGRLSIIKQKAFFLLGINGYEKPRYQPNGKEQQVISQNTNHFVNTYIQRIAPVKYRSGFTRAVNNNGYDAFVVGSDQVWRPEYNVFLSAMYLDFAEKLNVKRIAYAASFGTSEWKYTSKNREKCLPLAKKFDLITVREKSGVDLCREHLGVEATWVLDPTMLLNREDYEKLVVAENEPKSAGTLFHYILDPSDEKKSLIEQVAAKLGLQSFTIMPHCQAENRTRWDVKHRIEDCVFPSVTSWLRGFMDAEMVIVDSFHGAVFSIIFNKPFWVIGNSKRGNARFESLLGLYGLEDRMITPGDTVDWNKTIDWGKVNEIREREKEKSLKTFEVLSK